MTWIRVNEEVDAIVRFNPDSSAPVLQAINWQGKRRTFVGIPQIEGDPESLYYDIRDKSTKLRNSIEEGSTGRSKALTIPGS